MWNVRHRDAGGRRPDIEVLAKIDEDLECPPKMVWVHMAADPERPRGHLTFQ